MSKKDFSILLEKYVAGTLTPSEKEDLAQLLHSPQEEEDLKALIDEKFKGISFREKPSHEISAIIFQRIMRAKKRDADINIFLNNTANKGKRTRLYAAATITLLIGCCIVFVFYRNNDRDINSFVNNNALQPPVAAPTVAKASITLANGKVVALDSFGNGTLAMQDNADIIKLAEGQIVYKAQKGKDLNKQVLYNTLNVSRGSKVVTITLSDGTRVWLNAASSLRYPTVFAEGARKVEVKGEVYFEVAKLSTRGGKVPFSVKVNDKTEVNVLGTHFNIHAYEDDPLSVTLLEGTVKVDNDNNVVTLKPGQQAWVTVDGSLALQSDADVEQVMAWKNGYFQFEGAEIKEVMREVARWYDLEIIYEGTISQHFRGNIARNVDANKVFKMLEATDAVHFRMEDKKIIVAP